MQPQPQRQDGTKRDEAIEILDLHNGDALEALRTMISERDAIEERLAIATLVMGNGFTRGWRP